MNSNYKILGIANPIVDYIMHVSDEYLSQITDLKGGMETISCSEFDRLLANKYFLTSISAGGSATNVMKGLARLGEKCAAAGKMGIDEAARQFLNNLEEYKITPLYLTSRTPTGKALCLVTPDGERTIRTYLGASVEMRADDLDPAIFRGVRLVHIEGYAILNEGVAERAMQMAHKAGAKISFDLANFEMVYDNKDLIFELLKKYVDILFANEKEVFALTGLEAEEGCAFLKNYCETVAVSRGKAGCVVSSKNSQLSYPAFAIENPLDTTGAGDLFASGFLFGCLNDKSLEQCAYLGCSLGAAVVQVNGAEIPLSVWERLRTDLFKDIN